jgi:hypothetical protein
MVEISRQAIRMCRKVGMKVQLGMTVVPENIDEVSAILELAIREGVFWMSLYPEAEIARSDCGDRLFLADVVEALEEQTDGQIRGGDFLSAAKIWSRLYRLTGRAGFRQKPTMVSLPLVVDGERLVPFNRLLSPLSVFRKPLALSRLIGALPGLLRYEVKPPTSNTLVVNIQQLQGRSAFDLEESTQNLMSFVHEESLLPFDIFNHVHRYPSKGETDPAARRLCHEEPSA